MAAFGNQVRQFMVDLQGRGHLGDTPGLEPPNKSRAVMQILLTLIIVGGGGYLLYTGGFSEPFEKLITGLIGTVIGYWFH